jgi:hypothetical protein
MQAAPTARSPTCRRSRTTSRSTTPRPRSAAGASWPGRASASPIIASVYALAGNAKYTTYGSYPYSHQSSFFDVTQGSNFTPSSVCGYLCTAEPGYDGPTGLGTPNGIGGF